MRIGVPKEIKAHEYRVGMTPAGVQALISHGHQVIIDTTAASGIGLRDDDYIAAGAEIAAGCATVFERTE